MQRARDTCVIPLANVDRPRAGTRAACRVVQARTAMPTDGELAAVSPAVLDCATPPDGNQTVTFDEPATCPPFNIACETFDQTLANPRILSVGPTEEWTVASFGSHHVLHMPVNPFTVCDNIPKEPPAPHWRDTLTLGPTVRELRMEYPFFTGDLVMHCQELDHADLGMAALVRIE